MGKSRYVVQYLCSLNDADTTDTWFLIDRRTGFPVFKDGSLRLYSRQEVRALLAQPDCVAGPAVSDFATKQNSDSYLAATAPVEGAEEGMAEKFREVGSELYVGAGAQERD